MDKSSAAAKDLPSNRLLFTKLLYPLVCGGSEVLVTTFHSPFGGYLQFEPLTAASVRSSNELLRSVVSTAKLLWLFSSDHIFHTIHHFNPQRSWHPSTLMSKECYRDYTNSFASMMLDFAKQAVEIHGTADADMKVI